MARIRTIKPEFFTSADVTGMTPLARLLFIGLWGIADREGRMKWRPADFKLQILPGDNCDIQDLCREIVDGGMVVLYGDGLAYIPSFLDHQSINPRETISKLPSPDAIPTRAHASNLDVHEQRGKEGKGKEEIPEANASGADAPKSLDPVKALFDDGLRLLTTTGTPERQARSLIGGWRKAHGDDATRTAIQAAYDCGALAPVEFIIASLTRAPKAHETWDQRRIREAMEAIQ